jgi:23S rRNA (cytosine1962-C5)-methyltransferase
VYDIDLPEFPFIIDLYKDHLHVSEYKSRHALTDAQYAEWLHQSVEIMADVFKIPQDKIHMKLRERQRGQKQYSKAGEKKVELIVEENGLAFIVNLSDYLDTGLFLDHRLTRALARDLAAGKRVLNLFAYTGSFSVYAAAGKAVAVTSVDMSTTYINWAKRNMQCNKLYSPAMHAFIQEDVLQFLKTVSDGSYDLIILDPPTFSNSKKMQGVLDVQRDHAELINQCLKILSPGGTLIFSTNSRNFELAASEIAGERIKDITKMTTPFDFAGKLRRQCFLIEK